MTASANHVALGHHRRQVKLAPADRLTYRAGAESALTFLRDHESRAIVLADFKADELHHQLVAVGGLHREESRAFLFVIGHFLSLAVIGHAPDPTVWDVHAALAGMEG